MEIVLWLRKGVVGDIDTDGHVDNFIAFVRPGEVGYFRTHLYVEAIPALVQPKHFVKP